MKIGNAELTKFGAKAILGIPEGRIKATITVDGEDIKVEQQGNILGAVMGVSALLHSIVSGSSGSMHEILEVVELLDAFLHDPENIEDNIDKCLEMVEEDL